MTSSEVKTDLLDPVAADIDAFFDQTKGQDGKPVHYLEEVQLENRKIEVGKTALSNGLVHYRVRTEYNPDAAGNVVSEDYHWGDISPTMHQSIHSKDNPSAGKDVELEPMSTGHRIVVKLLVDTFFEQHNKES